MPEPGQEPTGRRLLWRGFLRILVSATLRVYFRWRVTNRPRIDGAFVLVANHSSYLDPVVLGAASPRPVSFLINSMSNRSPLRWFYRLFGSIPIDPRGGNRDSLRRARSKLDSGQIIGVFPEGGITRDGGLLLGNPGAVALVLSRDVFVVPVGLCGVAEAFPYGAIFPRPKRVEVRFGEPIPASELMVGGGSRKEQLARATERIMREIGSLIGRESREDELRRHFAASRT
jgi:1-acyl-sn-glycerol-3-phosphate acyltransferase